MLDVPAGESLPIRIAWLVGLSSLSAAALVVLLTGTVRLVVQMRARRAAAAIDRWRPVFAAAVAGDGPAPLPLPKRDRVPVLVLWNHLRESVRGEASQHLLTFARVAGFDRVARTMVADGPDGPRLVGIVTAGNCEDPAAWGELLDHTEGASPVAAHAAAKAMTRIHPRAAAIALAPRLMRRTDWHPSRVIRVIEAAGPEYSLPMTMTAARAAPERQLPRMFSYLAATRRPEALAPVHERLPSCTEPEAIAAGLRAIAALHGDADLARARCDHPSPIVRVQAAAALGVVGDRRDVPTLTRMLGDSEWWVRNRAARSLAGLPFLTIEELDDIAASHLDPFAHDALRQVSAERRFKASRR